MSTPRYKINPVTGELQEVSFDYNGIVALKNFTTRIDGERLIIHSADDVNFSILEALVSEVEINGVVYDNPEAAQEALQRLVFNQNRPVVLPESERVLLQNIKNKVDKVEGKELSSNDFTNKFKEVIEKIPDTYIKKGTSNNVLLANGKTISKEELIGNGSNTNEIIFNDDFEI